MYEQPHRMPDHKSSLRIIRIHHGWFHITLAHNGLHARFAISTRNWDLFFDTRTGKRIQLCHQVVKADCRWNCKRHGY